MASPLGYVYSRADALKRQLYDMITNPRDYASMLGGRIVEGGQEREALMNQAFADPTNPLKITNEKALAALTDKIMQGEMGITPLGMFKPEQVKSVLPKTTIVDEAGNPKLMYHGTSKDIQQFKPGQTEASFVSPDVKFAEKFSDYSQDRSIKQIADQIDENPAQKEQLLSEIIDKAMQRGDLTNVDFPYHQQLAKAGFLSNLDMYTKDYWLNSFMNRPLKDAFDTVGIGKDVTKAISEMTTTGPNVLPVYVNVKNPFDYENPSHVNKVFRELAKDDPDFYQGTTIGKRLKRALGSGDWDSIEGTDVQDAIRKLGFDGFFVKEHGVKNLGVYDPSQIKSAVSDPAFQGLLSP